MNNKDYILDDSTVNHVVDICLSEMDSGKYWLTWWKKFAIELAVNGDSSVERLPFFTEAQWKKFKKKVRSEMFSSRSKVERDWLRTLAIDAWPEMKSILNPVYSS